LIILLSLVAVVVGQVEVVQVDFVPVLVYL
jgi:hypothetical protein